MGTLLNGDKGKGGASFLCLGDGEREDFF